MIWKKLLFPPLWLLVILTLISGAGLTVVFVRGLSETIPAYFLYALSFYTLTALICFCVFRLPGMYRQLRQKLMDNALSRRYLTDRVFRATVSLYRSLGVNLLYVGTNLWLWHRMGSYWFLVLAVYYAILSVMRFLLVRYVRVQRIGTGILEEWKRSRICACILLLVNLSLSGAVLMILYQDRGYEYPGILIYVMALYTFYSTIHALVDIVKYRRLGSPVMSTAKIVSFSAALVSMLNLETAMFAQFGADLSRQDQRIFIILTGAGISLIVVALSLNQIRKATKAIRREKYGE